MPDNIRHISSIALFELSFRLEINSGTEKEICYHLFQSNNNFQVCSNSHCADYFHNSPLELLQLLQSWSLFQLDNQLNDGNLQFFKETNLR